MNVHMFVKCPKGDACQYWCFVEMCTKLHKIISKIHNASSFSQMERSLEKLDKFEEILEKAYAWVEDHEGKKLKSCSSLKKVSKLQKAGTKLRETYESESEDSDSSDEEGICMESFCHQMGMPKMEVMGVREEAGQKSLEKLFPTPKLTLECAYKMVEDNPIINMGALVLCYEVYNSHKSQNDGKHDTKINEEMDIVVDEHDDVVEVCDESDVIGMFLSSLDDSFCIESKGVDPWGLQSNKEPIEDLTLTFTTFDALEDDHDDILSMFLEDFCAHDEESLNHNHEFEDDMLKFEELGANPMDVMIAKDFLD